MQASERTDLDRGCASRDGKATAPGDAAGVEVAAGKVSLGVKVDRAVWAAFTVAARLAGTRPGSLLLAFVHRVTEAAPPDVPAATASTKLNVRLLEAARRALLAEARASGTTPSGWARMCLEQRLLGGPRWDGASLAELRAIRSEVAAMRDRVIDRETAKSVAATVARIDRAMARNEAYWNGNGEGRR